MKIMHCNLQSVPHQFASVEQIIAFSYNLHFFSKTNVMRNVKIDFAMSEIRIMTVPH